MLWTIYRDGGRDEGVAVLPTATAKHFRAIRDDGREIIPMQWEVETWEWWCPRCKRWLKECRC